MLNKHRVSICISFSLLLLLVAALLYPGGSQADLHSVGYNWKTNYLCNLFNARGMNGDPNPGRNWAIAGMFFLCAGMAVFFFHFAYKISSGRPAKMIRYSGTGSMCFAFLVITPYHDTMTTLASVFALVALFYVTLFLFRSKLVAFKLLSAVCIAVLYLNNYIYYTHHYIEILPLMQKISFLLVIGWVLGLEYGTKKADFQPAGK